MQFFFMLNVTASQKQGKKILQTEKTSGYRNTLQKEKTGTKTMNIDGEYAPGSKEKDPPGEE